MRAGIALLVTIAAVAAAQKPAPKTDQPPAQKLDIVQTVFHDRRESAPPITPDYKYVAGELMYFSFRVGGYTVKKDAVDLRWQLVAADPEGLLLWEPMNGAFREEVTHNDENWLPRVAQTLPLPAQLAPGTYKLKIRVADELAQTTAEKEVTFEVGGPEIPKAEKLTILNTGFYRSERDRTPMSPAVYKPGDTLLARFDLAGFQLGEKNRFDVEYGLRILRPSGKEMYAEPKAASESDAPYYPKRLMRGGIGLNLTADLTPGEYTMVILAKDNVGNQTAEQEVKFTVAK